MEQNHYPPLSIKMLAEDDRPREKLKALGPNALNIAELLAIIIGNGHKNASALQLAQQLLAICNNNLSELSRMSLSDIACIKGLGQVKAIVLNAALELGRRRREEEAKKIVKITNSIEAYMYFEHILEDYQHEEFWIMLLNRNNMFIAKKRISVGGVSGTVVDPKIIFNAALNHLASGIILCHNHPSGNLTPSQQDIDLTKKLYEAGKLLDIDVCDHLIIGNKSFFSFADNGYINRRS